MFSFDLFDIQKHVKIGDVMKEETHMKILMIIGSIMIFFGSGVLIIISNRVEDCLTKYAILQSAGFAMGLWIFVLLNLILVLKDKSKTINKR